MDSSPASIGQVMWLPFYEATRRAGDTYSPHTDCTHPLVNPFIWDVARTGRTPTTPTLETTFCCRVARPSTHQTCCIGRFLRSSLACSNPSRPGTGGARWISGLLKYRHGLHTAMWRTCQLQSECARVRSTGPSLPSRKPGCSDCFVNNCNCNCN